MSGILEELETIGQANEVSVLGNPEIESEITLEAIRLECENDKEFAALLESAGTEMALYGVISDAEMANEAVKRIVVGDWKVANFNRIAKRTAIRLAMINNDQLYTKYKKYRELVISYREKIYTKYGNKARVEARKIIRNSRNKAGNMTSQAGKSIADKMDKEIDQANNASNK